MLSPRLQAVLEKVGSCEVLADIGTDHAYLPIEACFNKLCKKAIACDINEGPLKTAASNIHEADLNIETRLGDGLDPLSEGEADCIVITGMGGKRIIGIIEKNLHKIKNARLILQPQHDIEELRRVLHSLSFEITDEKLIREGERFYIIICAEFSKKNKPWTDKEYFLGKTGKKHWQEYCRHRREKILRYIDAISDKATRLTAETQLKWLEEDINENG